MQGGRPAAATYCANWPRCMAHISRPPVRTVRCVQVSPALEPHLRAAAELLGVESEGLSKALTTRTRHTVDGGWACAVVCLPVLHAY